jgi:hypothetical protein
VKRRCGLRIERKRRGRWVWTLKRTPLNKVEQAINKR